MKLANRAGERRPWFILAMAAGVWCSGWTWVLLALTEPFPGVLTGRPGAGAREVIELLAGRSYLVALLVIFLLSVLLVLLLGGLRIWLDPGRRARDSMLWPLRSCSLMAVALAWLAAVILFAFSGVPGSATALTMVAVIGLASLLAFPFWAWNTRTLAQSAPRQWWIPQWPGLRAAGLVLGLLAAGWIGSVLVELGALLIPGPVALAASWIIGDLLLFASFLFAGLCWLTGGDCRAALGPARGAMQHGLVGEYVYQQLLLAVALLTLLFPLLPMALLSIFMVPQFEEWLSHSGQPSPVWFAWITDGTGLAGWAAIALAAPVILYQGMSLGRLLGVHGFVPRSIAKRAELASNHR